MPKSAPGSDSIQPVRRSAPRQARAVGGFTLIELMVVIAIIAIGTGLASLALRDTAASQLEREAVRLSALLESARTQARSMGIAVVWRPSAGEPVDALAGEAPAAFRFVGLPRTVSLPGQWLNPAVQAEVQGAPLVRLGPEPLIGAQRIVLSLDGQRLALATDGLGPFAIEDPGASATPGPR